METFHSGELEAQRRAGVRQLADKVGRIIGPSIPAAAAAFLAGRTFVVTSTSSADGAVHASILSGPAGFTEALDPSTISIRPRGGDRETVQRDLRDTGSIGVLAIDFATRRRMRANGTAVVKGDNLLMSTREVYSNCPQYIHSHEETDWRDAPAVFASALDDRQIALIESANTFFIASSHPERGGDASHRGGDPGFVSATRSSVSWLDFPGNNMFNTLGNLLVNPRCSLLFVDFGSGSTLRVDGRASIEWGDPRRIEIAIETVMEQR